MWCSWNWPLDFIQSVPDQRQYFAYNLQTNSSSVIKIVVTTLPTRSCAHYITTVSFCNHFYKSIKKNSLSSLNLIPQTLHTCFLCYTETYWIMDMFLSFKMNTRIHNLVYCNSLTIDGVTDLAHCNVKMDNKKWLTMMTQILEWCYLFIIYKYMYVPNYVIFIF